MMPTAKDNKRSMNYKRDKGKSFTETILYVTGFTKTDQIVTRTEFKFKSNNNDTLMHCPEASTTWQ